MASPAPSSGFFAICLVHSLVALTCGILMMFYLNEMAVFGLGQETARKLQGSTPHDQLLIQTSDSFAGLLLFAIGSLLFMVAFVKDRDFQILVTCTIPVPVTGLVPKPKLVPFVQLFPILFVNLLCFQYLQSFFAKGCILLHAMMALWRVYFERRLEVLARDWPRQLAGDIVLGLSWVLFLFYSWREKYD